MPIITLPIDGVPMEFFFEPECDADEEMAEELSNLVAEIGPARRDYQPGTVPFEEVIQTLEVPDDARAAIAGVAALHLEDDQLNARQQETLANLTATLLAIPVEEKAVMAKPPDGVPTFDRIRAVRSDQGGFIVALPDNDGEFGEVLYFTDNAASKGLDYADIVFELVVGLLGLVFALSGVAARLARALKRAGFFDRIKGLLQSPRFREALKKLIDLLPGGKKGREVFEALRELIEIIWTSLINPNSEMLKKALKGMLSGWTVAIALGTWLIRFLTGGGALAGEVAGLLGMIAVKVLAEPTA